jgi:hypothetical protein
MSSQMGYFAAPIRELRTVVRLLAFLRGASSRDDSRMETAQTGENRLPIMVKNYANAVKTVLHFPPPRCRHIIAGVIGSG